MNDLDPMVSSPLAMQLAARVERLDPPKTAEICAAAALATIALLDDERSRPGGNWHDAVDAWNGARIRKIVRRARGSSWLRAQEAEGVTIERDGCEVRAFVPCPLDRAPDQVARLQIQSTSLDEIEPVAEAHAVSGLLIAVTPEFEMSWGKQAAQCAHAGQWAWMRSDPTIVGQWDAAGRPLTIVHPTPELWLRLIELAPIQIHDGGFTEVPAGTKSAIAWWSADFQLV
jgi:peptidyl-tRNA hydrolase